MSDISYTQFTANWA